MANKGMILQQLEFGTGYQRLILIILVLGVFWFSQAQGAPLGSEFLINSTTSGIQRTTFDSMPAVAADDAGNFVVVWTSEGQDFGATKGVYGQRYNSAGVAQGGEFLVNTTVAGDQLDPAVAMDASGDFVVSWTGQDAAGMGVLFQRFNAAGTPQGSETQANTYTTSDQKWSSTAMDAAGNFIVVWASVGQDGNRTGVYGQRFNAAGATQGSEMHISTQTQYEQDSPVVSMNASGAFVVCWSSWAQDSGNSWGSYAQRFNAAGVPQGSEFRTNTTTSSEQWYNRCAMDDSGNFMVVWESQRQDSPSDGGVFAQLYNASGTPQGGEIAVNTTTAGEQWEMAIAANGAGGFTIVWSSDGQDGDQGGIYGQRYFSNGTSNGGEFHISTTTSGMQERPAVAQISDEEFVVVWSGNGPGDTAGIFGQRFGPLPPSANVVTNTNDSGAGSLREALDYANLNAGTTITFDIPDTDPGYQTSGADHWWRIAPTGALPTITATGTTIDGTSQTTNRGDVNSLGPEIEINGASIPTAAGFTLTSADGWVRGIVLNGFTTAPGMGVLVDGASATGNRITGCYIGTNAVGDGEDPNFYGITLSNGASGTVIGEAGEGNVISGSDFYGIRLDEAGANTTIQGNRIGTNAAGDAAIQNSQGFYIDGGTEIVIGGPGPGEGNLISGNNAYGMNLQTGDGITIQGNWMGLNQAGTDPIPDGGTAIYGWSADNVTIGGSAPGEGNIIAGNDGYGIALAAGPEYWVIQGNTIGTGPLGTETNLGNTGAANIRISSNDISINATIGGANPGEGNLIAYASGPGIDCSSLGSEVEIIGNVIRNNGEEGIVARIDNMTVAMNTIHDNGPGFDNIFIMADAADGKWYHNTIHGSGDDGIEVTGLGHDIRNNIITGSAGYGINVNAGTMTESNNIITGTVTSPANVLGQSNVTLDGTDLNTDPLYINAAGGDFALTECSSPAINTGLDLGVGQPDLNGSDPGNYNGSAPDRGAFETACVSSTYLISGTVFEDADFVGTASGWDGGTGDLALANVEVELYDGSDVYQASTTTAGDGSYSFTGLNDGSYKVRVRSATIGDADTPPAGGLNTSVPGTWTYPLAEMTWAHSAAMIGGQNPGIDDGDTGNDSGPGDTYVAVNVSGADIADVDFGFAYNLIVNTADDGLVGTLRSDQGSLRQFIKNANAIGSAGGTTANVSEVNISGAGPHMIQPVNVLPALADIATLDGDDGGGGRLIIDGTLTGNVTGLAVTSSDVVVTNLICQNFIGASSYGIRVHDGTTNVTLDNCVSQGHAVDGIRIDWLGVDTDLNHSITGCTVSGNGHDGVVLVNADGVAITGSVIENSVRHGINVVGANNGSGNNLIAGNTITGNGTHGISIWDTGCTNNTFQSNVFHSNVGDGIRVGSGGDGAKFFHNTFDNNGTGGSGSGISINSGVVGVVVRNSLFTNNNNYGIQDNDSGASTTIDFSGFNGNGIAACNFDCLTGSQNISADPQYAAPGPPTSFFLTECTSPAIDAGVDLGVDQPDLNGGSSGNYNGSAPDMGPLETSCSIAVFDLTGVVFEDVDFAGTATDWDGGTGDLALASVDVELYDGSDIYQASTTTAGDGSFSFTGLADGSYKVRVRSATLGDADTPPAGGLHPTVPGTWPYPLAEMTWAYNAALIGGQDELIDDTATSDNAGPGDTWVAVTVSGADVNGVDFGFSYDLITNEDDDGGADNVRSKQGCFRQFIKNSNAIVGVNKSWFQIAGP